MKNLKKEQMETLVNELIKKGNAILAVKVTPVKVRKAAAGETVDTFLQNGLQELSYVCNGTEMIVTNPDGEVYAMPRFDFDKRYTYTDGDEVAYPVGKVRHLVEVPAEYLPISFPAPWGGEMKLADGYLNYDDMEGIYAIGREEFHNTHRLCDEQGKVI